MTTLVVLIPARAQVKSGSDNPLGPLPFVLFGDAGQELRAGSATLPLLPAARRHVLLLAARDVVLLRARVPALKGPRLRLALPNLIEEQLVTDAARCHVAVGPEVAAGEERTLAVVDRGWLRFVLERFQKEQRAGLRVVPVQSCFSLVPEGEVVVHVFGQPGEPPPSDGAALETVLEDQDSSCGLAVAAADLASTARHFAGERPIVLRVVTDPRAQLLQPAGLRDLSWAARTESVSFSALARRALTAPLDLCQFEFSAQSWQAGRNSLKRWRLPLGLAAASALACLIGLNLDWLLLAREYAALEARASSILLGSFPSTKVVLDAPLQMRRELEARRGQAGETDAGDFLVLCDHVARALGPLGPNAIASVDYADHALTIGFAPGVAVDEQWSARLTGQGLRAESSGGKWIIRSGS